ncbi:MAG: DNA mismatch repair endonuclease MutL [bacterium]|jgi:DNA mismatch repair protein MutL
MSRIVVLDREVANQIAAGEVIERPAAVVKELTENSIDAGATHIDIEFTGAGLEFIRVRDDGFGMTQEEVMIALHRHATSKIRTPADLARIMTLGFRGEALPSIAAVSRLEILTAPAGAVAGSLLKVEGGGTPVVERHGAPVGTVITVRDLFFNTPARKKYLKNPQTEARHIMEAVVRLALAYPEVSFSLTRDNRRVLTTTGKGGLGDVIPSIFGSDLWEELLPVEANDGYIKLTGYIGRPSLNRSNRTCQYFFVNKRYVKNPLLTAALERGYHNLMLANRFPVAFLALELDPREVDVNVHPTKLQIRFAREREIGKSVYSCVTAVLSHSNLVPGLKPALSYTEQGKGPGGGEETGKFSLGVAEGPSPEIFVREKKVMPGRKGDSGYLYTLEPESETKGPNPTFPLLEPLGQVYKTYIIARGVAGLFLIDQHAAHERIVFEDLLKAGVTPGERQNLLVPLTLELPYSEWEILRQNLELFRDLGFRIDEFGPQGVIIHSVPAVIPRGREKEILLAMLGELGTGWEGKPFRELQESIAIVLACHSAIRAGKVLSVEEMGALIQQLGCTEQPFTCPHGRPTIIHLSAEELEKKFKRL